MNKVKNIGLTILILIFLITVIFYQRSLNENRNLSTDKSLLLIEKQTLKKEVNELGDTIIRQKAIIIGTNQQLKDFTDTIFNLKGQVKSVEAYYKEISSVKWDTLYIPYESIKYVDSIIKVGDTVTNTIKSYLINSIPVPTSFKTDSSLFSIKGRVLKNGVSIDSLNIPDTFNLRIVETKGKFFKPSQVEFQSFHSNPLISVTGVNSIIYKVPKKSFFKWLGEKLIWVGIGYGLSMIK